MHLTGGDNLTDAGHKNLSQQTENTTKQLDIKQHCLLRFAKILLKVKKHSFYPVYITS